MFRASHSTVARRLRLTVERGRSVNRWHVVGQPLHRASANHLARAPAHFAWLSAAQHGFAAKVGSTSPR
ncbi:MAG: hypothetical protein AVDCRST_MAG29-1186 [uncultured Nocardioidaceae bacterium]|uniref:Uncharacterized protein n=1 Tax=uncultured Nocardioidaceae bacterium TaxID=253824 RepID=A0A6J4LIH8_9ACTN|nr:MAG: hypothetical protein AVDCRST_MAG29-1186 [uncultured Nocardioidaceae bacterium]